MHKRIYELALAAGGSHYPGVGGRTLEKFAELLVQDCVEICNKIYFDTYPEADEFERSQEGDAIKAHFGIKS